MTFPRPHTRETLELIPVWHGGMHKEWWPEPPRMPAEPPSKPVERRLTPKPTPQPRMRDGRFAGRRVPWLEAQAIIFEHLPATFRELVTVTGYTDSMVNNALFRLRERGLVQTNGKIPRIYFRVRS